MALTLGSVQEFGEPIKIKCASRQGTLMRISRHEFNKKILCNQQVQQDIHLNIQNKLAQFLEKTGLRFKNIKNFHSAKLISDLVKESKIDEKRAKSPQSVASSPSPSSLNLPA